MSKVVIVVNYIVLVCMCISFVGISVVYVFNIFEVDIFDYNMSGRIGVIYNFSFVIVDW